MGTKVWFEFFPSRNFAARKDWSLEIGGFVQHFILNKVKGFLLNFHNRQC